MKNLLIKILFISSLLSVATPSVVQANPPHRNSDVSNSGNTNSIRSGGSSNGKHRKCGESRRGSNGDNGRMHKVQAMKQ